MKKIGNNPGIRKFRMLPDCIIIRIRFLNLFYRKTRFYQLDIIPGA
jgi:hypothetical protein